MTLGRPTDFSARATREGGRIIVSGPANFGAALLLGSMIGGLAAVPGTIRAASQGAPALLVWLALAGAVSVPAGLVVAALRSLRPAPDALRSVAWSALIAFGPIVFFARGLWAGTHHRPLGAVTFGFAVVLLLFAVLAIVARVRGVAARAQSSGARRTVNALLAIAAGVSIAIALIGAAPALRDGSVRAWSFDVVVLLVLGTLSVNARIPATVQRPFRLLGPVVYSVLGVAAAAVLRSSELEAQVRAAAPVLLMPWTWVFSG